MYSDKKAAKEYREAYNTYIDDLKKAQSLMLSGGSEAETLCNLTLKVWSNSIYKEKTVRQINTQDKKTVPVGFMMILMMH